MHMQAMIGGDMALAIALHTVAMFVVMAGVAWFVYKKLGLAILRRNWINFDLIWAIALLVVGSMALWGLVEPAMAHSAATHHAGH